ncbi:hypothetical protein T492DRAFT_410749 [Pavlovales sp. CCMP2436]|nr:hypothetical protein T492DRAFT_410749 [Pavlovales sp. CCMP2436]
MSNAEVSRVLLCALVLACRADLCGSALAQRGDQSSAWRGYLRAVYGDAEPAAELLAGRPYASLRFVWHTADALLPALAPLLNGTCLLRDSGDCASYCIADSQALRRVRFPSDASRRGKCQTTRDPMRDIASYGSFLEPCLHGPGPASASGPASAAAPEPDERTLRVRRELVQTADHSWLEVIRVATSIQSTWQEGLSTAWSAFNERKEQARACCLWWLLLLFW